MLNPNCTNLTPSLVCGSLLMKLSDKLLSHVAPLPPQCCNSPATKELTHFWFLSPWFPRADFSCAPHTSLLLRYPQGDSVPSPNCPLPLLALLRRSLPALRCHHHYRHHRPYFFLCFLLSLRFPHRIFHLHPSFPIPGKIEFRYSTGKPLDSETLPSPRGPVTVTSC